MLVTKGRKPECFKGPSLAASPQVAVTWPPGEAQMVYLGPGTSQVQPHTGKILLAICRGMASL